MTPPVDQQAHEILVEDAVPDVAQPVVVATGLDDVQQPREIDLAPAPADVTQPVAAAGDGPAATPDAATPAPAPDGTTPSPGAAATASIAATALDVADEPSITFKDPLYLDEVGPDEDALHPQGAAPSALDNAAIYRIIRTVAVADSGDDAYTAIASDAFDGTPRHGLGFGLLLFTQSSGHLGRVLELFRKRDPDALSQTFGRDADALVATATAATPDARLAPVGGSALWSETWAERFRSAGRIGACQAAQNEEAIEGLFRPMLRVAGGIGFDTARGLAMVFDRVVVSGLGRGLRWVVATAGPLDSAARRQYALKVLGFDKLEDFQATVAWLPKDGRFGPATHAALVAALRADGRSIVPESAELQSLLVAAANGQAKERLRALRDSEDLADVQFIIT